MIWNFPFAHRLTPLPNDYFSNTLNMRKNRFLIQLQRILPYLGSSVDTPPRFLKVAM